MDHVHHGQDEVRALIRGYRVFGFILPLIWLLGIMVGWNCIQVGAAHLLPRRELPQSWQRTPCILMARTLGVTLIVLGLLTMYAVCAPIAQLPGSALFNKIYFISR